jgi:hypothetical protein
VIEVQVERAHAWQQPVTVLTCKGDHHDCAWQQAGSFDGFSLFFVFANL